MSYFLSSKKLLVDDVVEVEGEEAAHILLSRRMKLGEIIELQDPEFKRFEAEVVTAGKRSLMVKILRQVAVPAEPPVAITLFQSFLQEKALDFILQKSTELGAVKIILFNSANTATKLAPDQFAKKLPRWNKILWEAAKQSSRARIPELEFIFDFANALVSLKDFDKNFLLDASGSPLNPAQSFKSFKSCSITTGPEGGFTPEEITLIKNNPNTHTLKLGPNMLRSETAAIAALSLIHNI